MNFQPFNWTTKILTVYTHLQPIVFIEGSNGTSSHVPFWCKAFISNSIACLQPESDKASCTIFGVETVERWEIKQEWEGDKELVDTNWFIGCLVMQERVPFRRAMSKKSDAGDNGSKDGTDDGEGARADGSGWHVKTWRGVEERGGNTTDLERYGTSSGKDETLGSRVDASKDGSTGK